MPPTLDRKQVLYLDGIRHCAEMAGLAYVRLKKTLTEISVAGEEPVSNRALFTSAFLDAWSLVDVIDRFRALWSSLPNAQPAPLASGERMFAEIAQPIRKLRNVADHIAQRADYIVAHRGTALGILSWFTILQQEPLEGVICAIVPGTLQVGSWHTVNPAGQEIEYPTGLAHLSAGEFTVNLSETLHEMKKRIEGLEQILQVSLEEQAPNSGAAGADFLLKMSISFAKS